jgi:hypothetical protein
MPWGGSNKFTNDLGLLHNISMQISVFGLLLFFFHDTGGVKSTSRKSLEAAVNSQQLTVNC